MDKSISIMKYVGNLNIKYAACSVKYKIITNLTLE